MASTEREKTPLAYLEEARSEITREEFEKRFSDFLAAHDLDRSVLKRQMDVFFGIADEFRRENSGMRAAKNQSFLQDYRRCEKLMDDTEQKLEQIQQSLRDTLRASNRQSHYSSLARSINGEIASWQNKLGKRFFDERHWISAQKSILSKLALKTAVYEFTLDLVGYIAQAFPTLKKCQREVLVGAAMAGAGLLSRAELENDPVARIPMKITRAKEHYDEHYAGEGRVYSYIKSKKKKDKEAQRREKT